MPRKPPALDAVTPELVDLAEARVREAGAVAAKKLVDVPLSRAAEAQLAEALARRGLEQTGKHVRVALRDQLAAILAREASVPLAALRRVLRGATAAAEVGHLIEDALRTNAAQLVLRDGKEHLCRPASATLEPAEVDVLVEAAAALAKLRRKLAKSFAGIRPTLLTADVRALFPAFLPAIAIADDRSPPPVTVAIVEALRGATTRTEPF